MDFKKEYKRLVELVKFQLKERGEPCRNEDIANALGYTRPYFSNLLNDSGKVTETHVRKLKMKFSEMFENVTSPAIKKNVEVGQQLSENIEDIIALKAACNTLFPALAEIYSKLNNCFIEPLG